LGLSSKGRARGSIQNIRILNKYLDLVYGQLLDCYKNITFHVARHTFATTVLLSNGVPIETVSKLLGLY